MTTLSCAVDSHRSGWRLREFLAHKFRYLPAHIWDERVADRLIRVNDAVADAGTLVLAGDRISYEVSGDEPPVDFDFTILHEDDDCLAVAKSGSLPVHAGGRYIRNTLIAHLRATVSPSLDLAHRLDRETSGVVLLAKHRAAAAHFEREFHAGRAAKVYLAVVRGTPPPSFTVDAPIGRAPSSEPDPPRWRVLAAPAGRSSVTRFRVLAPGVSASSPAVPVSLLEVVPLTGRTQQIRIHAAHVGHPVLGDKIHGVPPALSRAGFERGDFPELVEAAGAPRQLLHAASLVIAHPAGGEPLQLSAPTPPDFALSWSEIAP